MRKLLTALLTLALLATLSPAFASAEAAAYTEAPELAARVEAGELPPVAERLPANPEILEVAEVGIYGGTWRQAVTAGTFNHAEHHLTGYLSKNALIYARDNSTITTGWLESYAHNDDYTIFTFKLREGLKWSDGVPVTTEDVAFWYNDVVKNTELTPTDSYYYDCAFEIVDDYSWTLTFEAPKPLYLAYWAYNANSRFAYPKHYLSKFHASYLTADELSATMAAESFDDWTTMFEDKYDMQKNMELPVLGPYIMTVDPATTNTLTYARNPYYWAVDQNGQQLPYIDEAIISIVESIDLVNMKVIAGEVDVQVAAVQESFSNYPLFAQYAEEMNYSIRTSDFNEPNAMNFHINATTVDPVKAPYLSSVDFRRALSMGLDRETVIATFYTVGPYSSLVAQTSYLEGSPYYDEEWATQYTQFDPAAANALLDELGMTGYDGDGYRMTANGEPFDLVILCPNYDDQWIEVAEMVASHWRENLKLNITASEVDPSLWNERTAGNDYDITNLTGGNGFLYASTGSINSWTGYAGYGWGVRFMPGVFLKEGEKMFEPTPELARLVEVGTLAVNETDQAVFDALLRESIQIWKDNLYALGIGRRLPAINIVKNYFHNVANLDQDWAFGFCATSRGDSYWIEADYQ